MKRSILLTILSMFLAALMMLGALAEGAALAEETMQAIDLNEATGRLVIDAAGTYELTGTLAGSVLVDPGEGDVTLILNGATIASDDTAGIAAVSGESLTIVLADGSENSVSDGGSDDDHDAAIYSAVSLTFDGDGALTVNGNNQEGISTENADITFSGNGVYAVVSQDDGINAGGDDGGVITFNGGTFTINASGDGIDSNASAVFAGGSVYVVGSAAGGDAGIDTDEGYVVTGGSIVALGTDMIETPADGTTQPTLALSLEETVEAGGEVALVDESGEAVAQFTALQAFRTLIVSDSALSEGGYTLLVNGEAVSVDGTDTFRLTDTVTSVGDMGGGFGGPGMGAPGEMGGAFNPGEMPGPGGMEPPEDGMQPPEGGMEPPEQQG